MSTFVQPTIWILSGGGINIQYTAAGPHFHYHSGLHVLDFSGGEIRVVEVPDVGTLVSVTLLLTVDSGSTSFTVLLPRVNLPPPPALPAFVPGVTTVHHLSLVSGFPTRTARLLYCHQIAGDSGLILLHYKILSCGFLDWSSVAALRLP